MDVEDLTVVCNDAGGDGFGLDMLVKAGKVRKVVGSYFAHSKALI